MTIAYNEIPNNLRLPGSHIEFDASQAGSTQRMAQAALATLNQDDGLQMIIQDDYVGAFEQMGLQPIQILDENGDGTGEFKFNQWIEIDAPIRS